MTTDGSASAASETEVGSIYPTLQELRAAAAKRADTCVAGVTWCGMWRVEGVAPYVGIRIRGIGCNYGSLIGHKTTKKQLNVKQSRQLGYAWGFIRQKRVQRVLDR